MAADDPFNSRVACELCRRPGSRRRSRRRPAADPGSHLDARAGTGHRAAGGSRLARARAACGSHALTNRPSDQRAARSRPRHLERWRSVPASSPTVRGASHHRPRASRPRAAAGRHRRRHRADPARVRPVASFRPRPTAAVTATSLQSVAVLPFADLSPARDHEYFSDGIAEELSTRLGRVPGLKVAARTSAFAFKGTDTDVKAIGRALNVDALVEGQRASGRRARAHRRPSGRRASRLSDLGRHVGARRRRRARHAGRDRHRRAARASRRLGGASTRPAAATHVAAAACAPSISRAYDLYLQGRYFWHQRTRDSLTARRRGV